MPGETFTDYFHVVAERSEVRPEQIALGYLTEDGSALAAEEWTYGELIARSRSVAARLREEMAEGERAMLLYPPGLPFVAAFLGCLAAGVVAVPAPLPDGRDKAQDRLAGIVSDSGARVVLTESSIAPIVDGWARTLPSPVPTLVTDGLDLAVGSAFTPVAADAAAPAFLQYTSGSTSAPKGVVVTHGNLVDNEVEIGLALETDASMSMVSWLPQFHDMGLIGMLLHPLFQGGTGRFLSPITFVKRPVTWIRALSAYRATVSVAPNFAFDLVARRCSADDLAGLDLSTVRSILNGSEPVQWESIARFTALLAPRGLHEHAVMPVYGLAEATLFVTGTTPSSPAVRTVVDADELAANRIAPVPADSPHARVLVGSGHPRRLEVLVVDEDGVPAADGRVGEIWVRGGGVAAGYWNMPELSAATFDATPVGGTGGWLRTGDLGASVDGELFVTGRTKDVIIVNGRNLYAHDIEAAARAAAPALARGVGAAFAVGSPERLVLVHELRPEHLGDATLDDVTAAVRSAVFAEFSVPLTELVLVAKGVVARTTSGKIRRTHMRAAHEAGTIARLEQASQPEVAR